MKDAPLRAAIVVHVVDNFGDAGVAWRLARQLRHEHDVEATLWIDRPDVLGRFLHGYDPRCDDAVVDGVRVRALGARVRVPDPMPQVVVDAFGGGLPDAWLDAFEAAPAPPRWIVLEYLSAEAWVEGVHGRPSPPPRRRLARWFFCPGFTPGTGGLLRERGLLAERDAFVAAAHARDAPWTALGLPPPPAHALRVSLFCYPTDALGPLLHAWAGGARPLACLVPHGVAADAVDGFLGTAAAAGTSHRRGSLVLDVVPFVAPAAFDRRLWSCDFSVVRGEDSFVRAQWAARPFAWHAYPQSGGAYRAKRDAFLARYCDGLHAGAAQALAAFTSAFGDGDGASAAAVWPALEASLPAIASHARDWVARLAAVPDLATQLVDFVRGRL
ncbi:MAG: hypothetical protein BroJett026_00670 [Betaproteobacteria bacterium]|nr:MAG: hypothetical protein BroJett026_00670 [Betaproteobacteria bacterium]